MRELTIRDLDIDVPVVIDGVAIDTFCIGDFTYSEYEHGNLDIVNALANHIQIYGKNEQVVEEWLDEYDEINNFKYFIILDVKKLSCMHKYAQVDIEFELRIDNRKVIVNRVNCE